MKSTTFLAILAGAAFSFASPVPEEAAEATTEGGWSSPPSYDGGDDSWHGPPKHWSPPKHWGGPPSYDEDDDPPSYSGGGGKWGDDDDDDDDDDHWDGDWGYGHGIPPPPHGHDGDWPPPPHKWPKGSPFGGQGAQAFGNMCSSINQNGNGIGNTVSCCSGGSASNKASGLLGLNLGDLIPSGGCGTNLLSDNCSSGNVACCNGKKGGDGITLVDASCTQLNL